MAIDAEKLHRILGDPDSPTGKLVALRQTPPATGPLQTGVWYSNFSRVKAEAEARNLPFFAVWTNGDLCGFCRRFTKNILHDPFLAWMKGSDCLFWLGGSMDDNDEDRRGGIGFTWCRGPEEKVSYFPFVSLRQTSGGKDVVRFHGSGHDFDERRQPTEGTPYVLIHIHNILHPDDLIPVTPLDKPTPLRTTNATPIPAAPTAAEAPAKQAVSSSRLTIRINPEWDAEHIARFQNALKERGGFCPCRADKTAATTCMCQPFLDQKTPGRCPCGTFEKFFT